MTSEPNATSTDREPEGPMSEPIKGEWLTALRSGEFKQGRGKMHTATRNTDGTEQHEFCCLGVLCELAVAAGVVERVDDTATNLRGYTPTEGPNAGVPYEHYPPYEVAVWAGLPHGDTNPYVTLYNASDPDLPPSRQTISNVNDDWATFEDIAKLIEKNF